MTIVNISSSRLIFVQLYVVVEKLTSLFDLYANCVAVDKEAH